jgi:hypothetical protein
MREIRPSGSEGGEAENNRPSLPLSIVASLRDGGQYRARHPVTLSPRHPLTLSPPHPLIPQSPTHARPIPAPGR